MMNRIIENKLKIIIVLIVMVLLYKNYNRIIAVVMPDVLINISIDSAEGEFGSDFYEIPELVRESFIIDLDYDDYNVYFDESNNCEYVFNWTDDNDELLMMEFTTYNPNHSIFGVKVGGSHEKAIKKLTKKGFDYSEYDDEFYLPNIDLIIYRELNGDIITSIQIIRRQ